MLSCLNSHIFSALHTVHFEKWKNFLWNFWIDLLRNTIHQLVRCFWVFANNRSIFYFMEFFFLKINCVSFWSPCVMLITESISLDTSAKTTSRITSIYSKIWEEIDGISLFIALTTTSICIISDEMFFNNSINVIFKWFINHFFLKTLSLFFSLRLFSLPTSLLLGLESFGSYHLVSEFLVVSYSLIACCECWLPCIKLSLL